MKSLIIGGAGFVGEYLIRELLREGGQEVVVTKMHQETIAVSGVLVRDLDILDESAIDSILREEHPDYIFHMAAQSSVAVSWEKPQLTIDVNVKGAVNLLEAIRRLKYKPRVLLIGSGEEYGHVSSESMPIDETCAANPGNIYAEKKEFQNILGRIYE
ncbi:MAG: GDP-mannose 4,6-dehydratase, partial [Lachnospiraceae bacterium]|nr:GDP-mannose 4,6-dehydratase [Lachnospiraceae bacterium]